MGMMGRGDMSSLLAGTGHSGCNMLQYRLLEDCMGTPGTRAVCATKMLEGRYLDRHLNADCSGS